jgi:hypothetical protein
MYSLLIEERVLKVLSDVKRYPAKVHRQITMKIFLLQLDPRPRIVRRLESVIGLMSESIVSSTRWTMRSDWLK